MADAQSLAFDLGPDPIVGVVSVGEMEREARGRMEVVVGWADVPGRRG